MNLKELVSKKNNKKYIYIYKILKISKPKICTPTFNRINIKL
jgi:hypothetical protein